MNQIPLSLYIHIPWCIRKCPYCDFNSHVAGNGIPEDDYIDALLADLHADLPLAQGRPLKSIFIGGGTPSLFSADALKRLLEGIFDCLTADPDIEITLEANPGTAEQSRFAGYRQAGINRLSIGVQSFQDEKLKGLGRIHGSDEASKAIIMAREAGFDNFNLDLMYGLPQQTIDDALFDLQTAIDAKPTHISWYQLTLEPNTEFYKRPPPRPSEGIIEEMEQQGKNLLSTHDFKQYEVSAYARSENLQSKHNLNYWTFGDYLGIGAGAHGKITDLKNGEISRLRKVRQPKAYLDNNKKMIAERKIIQTEELPFEFMMNALRLQKAISFELFEQRTGMRASCMRTTIEKLHQNNFLEIENNSIALTVLGRRFLNDVLGAFLCH